MAKRKNESKAIFTADTADMNKKLEEVKTRMGTLSSEMKLAAATFKSTGNATEFYEQKQQILGNQLQQAQQKTEALSDKLEVAKRCYGENSAEAQRLEAQVNNAKAAEARIEAQIQQCNAQLERQQEAAKQDESAIGQLSNEISQQEAKVSSLASEYANAVVAFGKNSTEAKQLKAELTDANEALGKSKEDMAKAESAAKQLSSALDDVGSSGSDMSADLSDIAGGFVIFDYIKDGLGALADMSRETEEYRAHLNQLNTAFETSGRSQETANQTYQRFLGLVGDSDQAIEAAQDMNNLADAGGDIDTWYNIAAGAVAAFGDALPVENLIESANETIRTGQITGGLADAVNWTTINVDEMNQKLGSDHRAAMQAFNKALTDGESKEDALNAAFGACSTEQERQQILTTVLSSQYSELGQTFQDTNSDIIESRVAQDDLMQAQSELAAQFTPLQTDLTNLAAQGFGFLAQGVETLKQNMETVAPVAVGLGVAVVGMGAAMYGPTAAANALAAANRVLNAAMGANPIAKVVVLIAALVAAFITAYNTSEDFRNVVDSVFGGIKSFIGGAMEAAKGFVSGGIAAMQGAWNRITPFLALAQGIFNGIRSVIQTCINNAKGAVSNGVSAMRGAWNGIQSLLSAARSVFNGIVNAIRNPMQTARNVVSGAINAIKGFFRFRISWPHIPMPHFSIQPSGWKVGDLLQGSIPRLGISFYAKGGIMTSPTLFGINGENAMVGGEAGDEAILPVSLLQGWIDDALDFRESKAAGMLSQILSELGLFHRDMPGIIRESAPRSLDIGNERGVVRLVSKLSRKWGA